VVNIFGQLGLAPSSQRFKDDIKPIDKASESLLRLKPVTFRYKKEIDPEARQQFGLVAEEVEKVNQIWSCAIKKENRTASATTK
jgi:hypothetical protein